MIQFTSNNQAGNVSIPSKAFEVMIAPDKQTPDFFVQDSTDYIKLHQYRRRDNGSFD